MRKYFAWMFFVAGSVNLISEGVRHALDEASTLLGGPWDIVRLLVYLAVTSLFFWLWQRWK